MTLPVSPTNNMAAWYQTDAPVNTTPAQPPGPEQAVPNSPDGASLTARDYDGSFNYLNNVTSTNEFLENVIAVDSEQEGLPAQTVQPSIAGVANTALQWNNWTSGSVGVTGSKFS